MLTLGFRHLVKGSPYLLEYDSKLAHLFPQKLAILSLFPICGSFCENPKLDKIFS